MAAAPSGSREARQAATASANCVARGRRSRGTCPRTRTPGASRTVSPGWASRRGVPHHLGHGPSLGACRRSITGTSGACRASASAMTAAVDAEQHHAAQPRRAPRRRGRRTSCALGHAARDPHDAARRRTARSAPRARWWPWSRRRSATPSTVPTVAMRCAAGSKARSPSAPRRRARRRRGPARRRPARCDVVRRGRAARRRRVPSSCGGLVPVGTKARSTSRSSTTPSIDSAGHPSVKPMARQPSTTSASSTIRSGHRVRRRCRRPAACVRS